MASSCMTIDKYRGNNDVNHPMTVYSRFPYYTVSKKSCTPKAGRHKFCYFRNTKKIRTIRFVGNFILNKSCEFYYDDVTMTSFIGNK